MQTVNYDSILKEKWILLFTTWMKLEYIMVSEVSGTEIAKSYEWSLKSQIQKKSHS